MFLLSVETVPFNCHFCTHPGFPSYKELISHLIDMHLRFEQIDLKDFKTEVQASTSGRPGPEQKSAKLSIP